MEWRKKEIKQIPRMEQQTGRAEGEGGIEKRCIAKSYIVFLDGVATNSASIAQLVRAYA